MRVLIVISMIATAVYAAAAGAALKFTGKDKQGRPTALHLSEVPCSSPVVLGHLKAREMPEKLRARFQDARLTWGGARLASLLAEGLGRQR